MPDRDSLARKAASFKRDAQRAFDQAVLSLIELVFDKGDPSVRFLWENYPRLDAEANAILRGLSDDLAKKAKALAEEAIRDAFDSEDFGEIWDEETLVERFDMAGSHLKELLEIWIAVAALNGIRKGELRVLITRYLNNPFASPLWKGLPKDILAWGRGFDKNILEQIAVIGQNAIIGGARLAEWMEARRNGATYYIRRRGSYYHCPECDSLCGYPIPIETPFDYVHSRCMCYPEYHYDPIENV